MKATSGISKRKEWAMPAAPHPAGRQPRPPGKLPSQVVADNVRALRERRGHTQVLLAHLIRCQGLDWTQSTVSQVELGARHVNVDELMALAAALEFSPPDLLDPTTTSGDSRAVDLGMGSLTSKQFVHEWVRGVAGEVGFRLAGKTPELFKVKITYDEVGWHEEPQQ
jgi:transcriptional regulator with XRE-family HTH domain